MKDTWKRFMVRNNSCKLLVYNGEDKLNIGYRFFLYGLDQVFNKTGKFWNCRYVISLIDQ